ncbi:hypothetical protein ACFV23_18550, partial [Streptomyces sp. NPDC059627]
MRVLGLSGEDEMVACVRGGARPSRRVGPNRRAHRAAGGRTERLLTHPDLSDPAANSARRALLAATRGYGEDRDLFENFPAHVTWTRALLTPDEMARVRYIEYSYWVELSGGSRRPALPARTNTARLRAWEATPQHFHHPPPPPRPADPVAPPNT